MADVFISYARDDSETADELAAELKSRGVSVFFDKDVLVAGTDFRKEIAQALSSAKAVVVLLSANTKRSSWVQEELSSVIERTEGPRVIPVLLDSHAKENWVWPLVSDRHAVDLSNRQEKLGEVASRLATLISSGRQSIAPPSPSPGRPKRAFLTWAILISLVTLSAILLLPLNSDGILEEIRPTGLWLHVISGSIGIVVGYLISLWRK